MSPSAMSSRNQRDTFTSASLGQGRKRSIWVQLISPGNLRHRERKASPTGEKHSTTCKLARTLKIFTGRFRHVGKSSQTKERGWYEAKEVCVGGGEGSRRREKGCLQDALERAPKPLFTFVASTNSTPPQKGNENACEIACKTLQRMKHLSTKNCIRLSRTSGTPADLAAILIAWKIASNSSFVNRSGITPDVRRSLT